MLRCWEFVVSWRRANGTILRQVVLHHIHIFLFAPFTSITNTKTNQTSRRYCTTLLRTWHTLNVFHWRRRFLQRQQSHMKQQLTNTCIVHMQTMSGERRNRRKYYYLLLNLFKARARLSRTRKPAFFSISL